MLAGRHILVVEDEYLVALTLVQLLQDEGATVVGPYSNVRDAVEVVAGGTQHIDAGILDVNLDGETSFPIADALAQRGIFFLFATGYGAAALGEAYRHYPRYQKPYEPKELFQHLALGAQVKGGMSGAPLAAVDDSTGAGVAQAAI